MKKIIYTRPDGGMSVVHPAEGARLARSVTLADGTELRSVEPRPADTFVRPWRPGDGLLVEWAESEDDFVARIAESDVFATITDSPDIVRVKIGKELPAESPPPTMMLHRNADAYGIRYTLTPYQIVEESAVPKDRQFRNAWKVGARNVEHDMEKCREIHKGNLRMLRKPLFEANDLALRDAVAEGDNEKRAACLARRDALRNVTACPAIAAAATTEELKAAIPDALRPL